MSGKAGKKNLISSFIDICKKFNNYGGIDIVFVFIVLMLLGIGLVMMFSASYPSAYIEANDSTYYIKRQLGFAVAGIFAMLGFSKIKPDFWKWKYIPYLVGLGSYFLLCIVFLFNSGTEGIHRWIIIGPIRFQPSELAKFAVIVAGAFIYSKYNKKMSTTRAVKKGIGAMVNKKIGAGIVRESWIPTWLFCGMFGSTALLVLLESHLSGFILIGLLGVFMMFLGGVRTRWFVAGIALVLVVVILICIPINATIQEKNELLAAGEITKAEADEYVVDNVSILFLKGYQVERIISWLDKDYAPRGARWQPNQGLYAIGSGGFFGKGLGNSTQKYLYVSEPHNDMIFSIVCEELGFVGAAIIIVLFALLVWRGITIGLNAKTKFSSLLAMGLVLQVGLQALLNIAVATDTIPNTGISLPFFSYGGTSLVVLLSEMGIVLAVSRESRLNKK